MVPVVPDDVRMFRVVQSLPGTLQPRTAAMLVSLTTVIEICTQLNDGTQLSDTVRDVCEALHRDRGHRRPRPRVYTCKGRKAPLGH
jgi:hypothetical protein